ncbi:hypothetical protein MM221_12035 [Salipaludibacillus sp. LMS25]|uniref:hypothetical protein n=1 Tax=Salipaludibacillus sp. LMS25 TaxID=2924031 RepID=UPI0020D02157|nr:hypothetical protein [Salipaludibacillus sp. LMS25]UTR13374.1 hypothetical protein MM221_12035 [Salipaludibacillus sp. LMS25]
MVKFKGLFLTVAVLALLSACTFGGEADSEEPFPYNYIVEGFNYGGFAFPKAWNVTAISSHVRLTYRGEEPENHQYAGIPYRYEFNFGKNAEDNLITDNVIEHYNQEQALNEGTHRQLYYHTADEEYAKLIISTNGFLFVLTDFEETENWDVDGTTVMVIHDGRQWRANWLNDGGYYDLSVREAAGIDSEEAFRNILDMMVSPDSD